MEQEHGAPTQAEAEPQQQEGKAAGKPTDLNAALKILEDEKRVSAGKDRKVGDLMAQVKTLEAKLTAASEAVEGTTAEGVDRVAKLAAATVRLEELEKSLADREQALLFAIERKIPIGIAQANASRLPAFKAEIAELAEAVRAGIEEVGERAFRVEEHNREQSPQNARLKFSQARVGEIRNKLLGKASALDLAALGKMTTDEISQIPASIWERLNG